MPVGSSTSMPASSAWPAASLRSVATPWSVWRNAIAKLSVATVLVNPDFSRGSFVSRSRLRRRASRRPPRKNS
jgi:hypothetical protein